MLQVYLVIMLLQFGCPHFLTVPALCIFLLNPFFGEGGSFFLFWFMLLLFNYFGIVNFLVLTMLQVYLLIMLLQFGCCQFFLLYHSLGRVGLSLWVYFIVV